MDRWFRLEIVIGSHWRMRGGQRADVGGFRRSTGIVLDWNLASQHRSNLAGEKDEQIERRGRTDKVGEPSDLVEQVFLCYAIGILLKGARGQDQHQSDAVRQR